MCKCVFAFGESEGAAHVEQKQEIVVDFWRRIIFLR